MIKTIKKIGILNTQFGLPLETYQCKPPMETDNVTEISYITGNVYSDTPYLMCAYYKSDSLGNILDVKPVILEEGFRTIEELFAKFEYTLIEL